MHHISINLWSSVWFCTINLHYIYNYRSSFFGGGGGVRLLYLCGALSVVSLSVFAKNKTTD